MRLRCGPRTPFCPPLWWSFAGVSANDFEHLHSWSHHPVSSCRSQPLYSGLGAEEEWEFVPPASRSWVINVRHQEAAEQGHSLYSCTKHQEVPWWPEAQTISGGGSTGRAVCWGQRGVCVVWLWVNWSDWSCSPFQILQIIFVFTACFMTSLQRPALFIVEKSSLNLNFDVYKQPFICI